MATPQLTESVLPEEGQERIFQAAELTEEERAAQFELITSAISRSS